MSRYSSFCLLLLISLFLTACAGPVTSIPTAIGPTVTPNPNAIPSLTPFGPSADIPSPQPAASQTAQPASTFTPAPATAEALPHYSLDATLNYTSHSLSVEETVTYQNPSGTTLNDLVLAVEPNLWKNCFVPGDLLVNGQAANEFNLVSDRLELPLAAPLPPDATVNLLFHFDLALPPADMYHVFGYNEFETNLVDWYPFIVPYSNGWLLHPPANVGEHLVYDVSNFDVTLRLADPMLTVTIAAGAPAEIAGGVWHFRLQNARAFVFSASNAFQTVSTTANGISVTGYFFTSETVQAIAGLNEVAKALRTFTTLFGPPPYSSLTMVESPFFDGMEYDGLFFLSREYYLSSDGTVLNNLIDIAVHETAHQWWFGSVGNDQAMEPWLDEALATYSERLFYEQNYPEVTAWQAFRIDSYSPSGWVDTDIYHGENFRTYANAVYLRGAQFLQELRQRAGDPAFFAFLKDYAAQMAGKQSTSADFFRILRLHISADISDIVAAYFSKPY